MRGPNDIVKELLRRGIYCLYHYTPVENLASILEHGGILSRRQRRECGVHPAVVHGWGAKARGRQLEDYVCVSFLPQQGMMAKETAAVAVLALSLGIAARPGTLFVSRNTARNDLDVERLASYTGLEALGALFVDDRTARLRSRQSETLVRDMIEKKYIQGLRVVSPGGSLCFGATMKWRLKFMLSGLT